jgi:hypothetical protein
MKNANQRHCTNTGGSELGKIQNIAIARGNPTAKNELLKSHPNYSQPCDVTKTKTRAAARLLERQNQLFLIFQDRRHKLSSLLNVNFFNGYYYYYYYYYYSKSVTNRL